VTSLNLQRPIAAGPQHPPEKEFFLNPSQAFILAILCWQIQQFESL
jgi:hypothetical protein